MQVYLSKRAYEAESMAYLRQEHNPAKDVQAKQHDTMAPRLYKKLSFYLWTGTTGLSS